MKRLICILLLIKILMPALAKAENARELHDIAHFSVGYMTNTVSYAFYKTITDNNSTAVAYSLLTTTALAIGKELLVDKQFSGRDTTLGVLGGVTSFMTLMVIELDL